MVKTVMLFFLLVASIAVRILYGMTVAYAFPVSEPVAEQQEMYRSREAEYSIEEVSRAGGAAYISQFIVTAYDLSYDSCEKTADHPAYGITASGENLVGQTWQQARKIAVDPDIIPLGAKVYIRFQDPRFSHYDGIYQAADTGGAIEGKRLDLFHGDYHQEEAHPEVIAFGKRSAQVWKIIR